MKDALWISRDNRADTYVAFRAAFACPSETEIKIRTVGSSWFQAWLDGDWLLEGPLRFSPQHIEYDVHTARLSDGGHVLAFQVHHIGFGTRMLQKIEPFLWCQITANGVEVPLTWRAAPLPGYRSTLRRINPQLGWMEHCVTTENPSGWNMPGFDDTDWLRPIVVGDSLPEPKPAEIGNVLRLEAPMRLLDSGGLASTFGYSDDDPPVQFFLRERNPTLLPTTGSWHLYDLGRVRLGNPRILIDAPAGTILEIARAEQLTEGRVAPWINLSLGPSANLDRYVLHGGRQTIQPLTPKGGRYLEVHIVNSTHAKILGISFHERTYHQPSEAQFKCDDPLLEQIWATGIETYRACAEDALTDNPTRERGQWINDVSTVHLAIASVAYHDLRLNKRALCQAADCHREDGLVAGMCPGGPEYLPSVSLQWVAGVVDYLQLTGDIALLDSLYPAAESNLAVFERALQEDGLHSVNGWNFIDWAYHNEEPLDLAVNLYYVFALRCMIKWCEAIERDKHPYLELCLRVEAIVKPIVQHRLRKGFPGLGYHCTVFAAILDLLPHGTRLMALNYLKQHLQACFPNNISAPRNDRPFHTGHPFITPYFAHYSFPVLIEAGEMDFVLDQYRRCWGWMLEGGQTTWTEVFDTRWSNCHAWSGAPTWQLTRYLSGLHPRWDLGKNVYEWKFHPGSLQEAFIRLPHAETWIEVHWMQRRSEIQYIIKSPVPMTIRGLEEKDVTIHDKKTFSLRRPAARSRK